MGWSNKPDAMKRAVELHPCWSNHRAVDRRAGQKENDLKLSDREARRDLCPVGGEAVGA